MNHLIPIRVYYEDTDSGGVVYHANYLKFAERARTELLRSLGFENKSLQEQEGIIFVVRHIEADYLKPAFLDCSLQVRSEVLDIKNASIVLQQNVFREEDLVCAMKVVLVCVDKKELKTTRLPDDIKSGFEKYKIKG